MRRLFAAILVLFSSVSQADECELILFKLIEKLEQQGDFAKGKNVYQKEFSSKDFLSSCEVNFKEMEYVLHLRPDEVSIVVSIIDEGARTVFKGPFYSAYKK